MKDVLKELNIEAVSKVVPCCFILTEAKPSYPIIYANDLFVEMLGYSDYDEMYAALDGLAANYVVPDDEKTLEERSAKVKAGQVTEATFRVYCKDGRINYIRQRSKHKKLEGGKEVIFASYFNVDQYEHQARRDEIKMRSAMSNLHVAVWECDFASRTNIYSPETVRDFKVPRVMTNVPQSLIESGTLHPDSINDLKNMYDAVMSGEPFAEGEIKTVHNGEIQWLKHKLTTIYDNGKPVSAVCTAQDITREKALLLRMESEISRREAVESALRGKGYYDLTDDLIIEYDTSRLVAEPLNDLNKYSEAVSAVMSQIPDEEERDNFSRLFSIDNLRNMFRDGKSSLTFEYRRDTPEGVTSWVSTRTIITKQPVNNHIVAFMYTTDINDVKIARAVVDSITTAEYDYIMLIDARFDSYTIFSHKQDNVQLMSHKGEDYWTELKAYLRSVMVPEDLEDMLAIRTKSIVLDTLKKARDCQFLSNIIDTDGNKLIKQINYSYLNDSSQYILVTCADVTRIMEQETRQQRALESALLAAKQASKAKSEFLSRMSHEIRTPMNAILGMSALALQAIGNDEEVVDCVSKIGISGHYLLSLINDILDMSRIESGKMLLHNAPFNFPEFVSGINTVIYGQAESKNINYETVISHGIDDGYIGDAMKLQQVLINILGNAVKFTPEGGKITFSISSVSRNSKQAKLRFSINDTGCGISEDAQNRIFDAFEQQDNSTTSIYGGSGLGLAISRSLVELMNGTIKVRSIVNIGTEFTVEVPLEVDPSIAVTHTPPRYSFADLNTLIVDDDLLVCEQTADTLRDIGMIPEWVTSGKEAVERVKELWSESKTFDFILIDWKMPEMDGIETSRQIRRVVGPDVTIIIITAYDWVSIEHEARAAGANMCISKPMFKSTLVSAFSKATGTAERERMESDEVEFDFTDKRVLLAEDHPLNAEIAIKLLAKKNCTVEHVENGLKALERFTSTPPGYFDAILMDVRMPIMDGLQATTNIRHWDKEDAKTIPIIAMTANAFEEDVERSKKAGMDSHLAKPIDPQLLYRVLYRLMN